MTTNRGLITLMALAFAHPASSACLDPNTLVSGYHVPLTEEVSSTQFIVIGKVVDAKTLQEDASDPEGVTAHLWRVKLRRQLKGHSPQNITIRIDNDSGRYLMAAGEKHLLFLTKGEGFFSVDSCGNSTSLPKGRTTLHRVEAELKHRQDAP